MSTITSDSPQNFFLDANEVLYVGKGTRGR